MAYAVGVARDPPLGLLPAGFEQAIDGRPVGTQLAGFGQRRGLGAGFDQMEAVLGHALARARHQQALRPLQGRPDG